MQLGRLLTAMITPFTPSGDVDYEEAGRLAEHLIALGNDGVVVCGTTGEGPAVETDEKLKLFEVVKARLGDRGSVIANTGSNNTRHSVELTREAAKAGVDGVLVVVPYYNKPTQDGMLRHFGAVAESTELPIVIYNIPGRTAANMLPTTLKTLQDRFPNIKGVKDSTGDLAQMTAVLRDRRKDFIFYSGDDPLFLPVLAIGGDGLVGVASHLCARQFKQMMQAFGAGDVARASMIHRELAPLFSALFATTSPIPVKWAMQQLGWRVGGCRPPLGVMPDDLKDRLSGLLDAYRPATV
ncbi:MAG: 4-hydroxy-tetrahydrodipicolinate synthase [Candidatus Eremiobacteraeota bacterium]|nr:4-hydroxy-tetrahydrodipicolinate synthase [Candidatus Eremiobacteraeota bacterium]